MYRFVGRMTADDIEAVAAQAYVEMLEAGFTRVGEFHYIHHDVSGAPYGNIGEARRAHRGCGAGQRHRPDAAAGVLRPCRFRRSRTRPGQRRFINDHRRLCAAAGGEPPRRGGAAGCGGRARAALVAGGNAGGTRGSSAVRWGRSRPSSISPNRPGKSTNASPGAASGRCNGCSTMRRSIAAGASSTPPMRPPTKSRRWPESGAVAGLCPITEANLGDGTFNAPGISRSRRRVRRRLGFQRPDRRHRRIAAARIFAAAGASGAQCRGAETAASTGRALFDGALQGRLSGSWRCELGADRGRLRRYRQP